MAKNDTPQKQTVNSGGCSFTSRSYPIALVLRYLQTPTEVEAEKNSTTIFPVYIDMSKPFFGQVDKVKNQN
jgi:hypothetical protein